MVIVGFFAGLKEAEAAGERLIVEGIPVQFNGISLLVDDADAERAKAILDLPEGEPPEIKPFHPCPTCGAADPIWYGKRTAIFLVVTMAGALGVGVSGVNGAYVILAIFVAMFIVVLAGRLIPNFECRNCHTRFSSHDSDRSRFGTSSYGDPD